MAKQKVELTLIADFGASGSKFLYEYKKKGEKSELKALFMEAQVYKGKIEEIKEKIKGGNLAEDSCWIKLLDQYLAVGYLAKQLEGQSSLKQTKFMQAIVKTVGAICAIAGKENLTNCKINVNLIAFLPHGEKANAKYYKSNLKKQTEKPIESQYGKVEININQIGCRSEGEGIYNALPEKTKLKEKVGILMMGYRNLSILIGEKGSVREGETTDLGMVKIVEEVARCEGLSDYGKLTKLLVEGKESEEALNQVLEKIFMREGGMNKQERMENLKQAILKAEASHIEKTVRWLREILEEDVSQVILCGGTAQYLGEKLTSAIARELKWVNLNWHGGISIPPALEIGFREDRFYRLGDIYGEYLYQVS